MDLRVGVTSFLLLNSISLRKSRRLIVVLPGYVDFFCLLLGMDELDAEIFQSLERIRDGIKEQDIFLGHRFSPPRRENTIVPMAKMVESRRRDIPYIDNNAIIKVSLLQKENLRWKSIMSKPQLLLNSTSF